MNIKAVCLDFDGTLAGYQGDFHDFLDSYRLELGLQACDLASFAERLTAELLAPGPVTLRSGVARTLEGFGLTVPDDLEAVTAEAVSRYAAQVALLPGALELLEWLSPRVPLALLTNGPEDMQRAAIRQVGLERYFRAVLISGDRGVAARKPDARVFRLACACLESAPEETVMVGDSLEADIQGALRYGLQALLVGGEAGEGYDGVPDLTGVRDWLEPRLAVRPDLR